MKHLTRRRMLAGVAALPATLAIGSVGNQADALNDVIPSQTDRRVVSVGPLGQHVFDPEELPITTGTTVEFVWESQGHTIEIDSKPEGSDWEGVSDEQSTGFAHEHTFEEPGVYEFYCDPHQHEDMEGTIIVQIEGEARFEVNSFVSPDQISLGEAYSIEVSMENTGSAIGEPTDLEYSILDDGTEVFSKTLDGDEILPMESGVVEIEIDHATSGLYLEPTSNGGGSIQHRVRYEPDDFETTFSIEVGGRSVDSYVQSGTVTNDGIRRAVSDWRRGEIDRGLLSEIVQVWSG